MTEENITIQGTNSNRFYFPINWIRIQDMFGQLYDNYALAKNVTVTTAMPTRQLFLELTLATTMAYILANNYQRHTTSQRLKFKKDTPSKLKGAFFYEYPEDIVRIIREVARPQQYGGNIYFPDPDDTEFDKILTSFAVTKDTVVTLGSAQTVGVTNSVSTLPFRMATYQYLIASLSHYKRQKLALESLEASPFVITKDGSYDYVSLLPEDHLRLKAALILHHVEQTKLNDWLVDDKLKSTAPNQVDYSAIIGTIAMTRSHVDYRLILLAEWKSNSVIANYEAQFPTIGSKTLSTPATVPNIPPQPPRTQRRKQKAQTSQQEDKTPEKEYEQEEEKPAPQKRGAPAIRGRGRGRGRRSN